MTYWICVEKGRVQCTSAEKGCGRRCSNDSRQLNMLWFDLGAISIHISNSSWTSSQNAKIYRIVRLPGCSSKRSASLTSADPTFSVTTRFMLGLFKAAQISVHVSPCSNAHLTSKVSYIGCSNCSNTWDTDQIVNTNWAEIQSYYSGGFTNSLLTHCHILMQMTLFENAADNNALHKTLSYTTQ